MKSQRRSILVWASWHGLGEPTLMGTLYATPARGNEVFSFEYDDSWLKGDNLQVLDPSLRLFRGQQYAPGEQDNFGVFLDSSPDRWGRVLMKRREAQLARAEGRDERRFVESDYLLGVHDGHRIGALRFRTDPDGPFLDNNEDFAAPPWTSLRELEHASLQLERDDAADDPDYAKWLRMLIAPGGSLGGARPKASVLGEKNQLWIAKFPSRRDAEDVGAWEGVVHTLAERAGLTVSAAEIRSFGSEHRTFLTQRFDRTEEGERLHFSSAMTLLQRTDGDDASTGASYLELAEFIIHSGAQPERDLEQLWRRIVFHICVSNTDDHLRNHGFLLSRTGWELSPAYDMNPNPHGGGLKLNISESDNSQEIDLALQVAEFFRLSEPRAIEITEEVARAVSDWPSIAARFQIPRGEQDEMTAAFRCAEEYLGQR